MFTPIGFYAAAAGGIVTDNLEQWMDVTQGSEALVLTDQSGNGRNFTNDGSANDDFDYNTSTQVWDITSDSANDAIGTGYEPTWTSAFSMDIWVNLTSTQGGAVSLVGNRVAAGTDFFIIGANETNGKIDMYWIDGASEYFISPTPASSYFDSAWHHVAFTKASDGTGTLYVDGSSVGSTSIAGSPANVYSLSLMGKYLSNRWFTNAKLGSYRVYSADIGSAGITQNYDAEKSHYGL